MDGAGINATWIALGATWSLTQNVGSKHRPGLSDLARPTIQPTKTSRNVKDKLRIRQEITTVNNAALASHAAKTLNKQMIFEREGKERGKPPGALKCRLFDVGWNLVLHPQLLQEVLLIDLINRLKGVQNRPQSVVLFFSGRNWTLLPWFGQTSLTSPYWYQKWNGKLGHAITWKPEIAEERLQNLPQQSLAAFRLSNPVYLSEKLTSKNLIDSKMISLQFLCWYSILID